MNSLAARQTFSLVIAARFALLIGSAIFALCLSAAHGKSKPAPQNETKPNIVIEADTESESDILTYNKNVVVRGKVKKGVMTFGGDVTIEPDGRVEGDVAAFGGSIRQREKGRIGGDVIVFGGSYHHGKTAPDRNPESQSVIVAGYEEELREIAHDPTVLIAPQFTAAFVAQRIIAALFWFVLSLVIITLSPGAISRTITRLNLSGLRVAAVGFFALLTATLGVALGLKYLPTPVSAALALVMFALLALAYVFGYVTIQIATGKYLQKRLFGERGRSESIALLLGSVFWTLLLSLPYIWTAFLIGLLVVSFGLILTARPNLGWKLERG